MAAAVSEREFSVRDSCSLFEYLVRMFPSGNISDDVIDSMDCLSDEVELMTKAYILGSRRKLSHSNQMEIPHFNDNSNPWQSSKMDSTALASGLLATSLWLQARDSALGTSRVSLKGGALTLNAAEGFLSLIRNLLNLIMRFSSLQNIKSGHTHSNTSSGAALVKLSWASLHLSKMLASSVASQAGNEVETTDKSSSNPSNNYLPSLDIANYLTRLVFLQNIKDSSIVLPLASALSSLPAKSTNQTAIHANLLRLLRHAFSEATFPLLDAAADSKLLITPRDLKASAAILLQLGRRTPPDVANSLAHQILLRLNHGDPSMNCELMAILLSALCRVAPRVDSTPKEVFEAVNRLASLLSMQLHNLPAVKLATLISSLGKSFRETNKIEQHTAKFQSHSSTKFTTSSLNQKGVGSKFGDLDWFAERSEETPRLTSQTNFGVSQVPLAEYCFDILLPSLDVCLSRSLPNASSRTFTNLLLGLSYFGRPATASQFSAVDSWLCNSDLNNMNGRDISEVLLWFSTCSGVSAPTSAIENSSAATGLVRVLNLIECDGIKLNKQQRLMIGSSLLQLEPDEETLSGEGAWNQFSVCSQLCENAKRLGGLTAKENIWGGRCLEGSEEEIIMELEEDKNAIQSPFKPRNSFYQKKSKNH